MTAGQALSLSVPQAAPVALALILVITLCFLPHPSRATLLWALSFAVCLLGLFGVFIAAHADLSVLGRAATGAAFASIPVSWSGVRSWRGRPSLSWVAGLVGAAWATALAAVPDGWHARTLSLVVFTAGFFSTLTAWELRRSPESGLPAVFAFRLVSSAFAALGVAALIVGLAAPDVFDDLTLLPGASGIVIVAYAMCATIGMAAMTQSLSPPAGASADRFTQVVQERMRRAREREEEGWALLAVQLDELAELRAVHGPTDFPRIVEDFERAVVRALPAHVDVGIARPGTMLALIDCPEDVIRSRVRAVLDAVARAAGAEHVVGLSASVGWVPARLVGYDVDALRVRAIDAAQRAAADGGDRWHRVESREG